MAILTFKYLRELQKNERDSSVLQKIDRNFYIDCAKCLAVDSSEADSIRPLLKSILEMRERKIITAALQSVRARIEPENLLSEEDAFFSKIIEIIKTHRMLIESVLSGKGAASKDVSNSSSDSVPKEKVIPEKMPANGCTTGDILKIPSLPSSAFQPNDNCEWLKIRAISDIPPFVAENMKSYGPLNKGDAAEFPKRAAEVLINAKVAERIE